MRWLGRYTHEGSGRERAGCRRDVDVGGGKACAGSGRRLSALAGQQHAGQFELSEKSNGSVLAAVQPDFRAKPGILGQ